MARRGDDAEPEALRGRSSGLEASVSSCSQPLHEPASTWRIARLRPRSGRAARSRGGGGGDRGGGSASAVRAGVAELEALVDRAGSRAAGCRQRRARPTGQFAYEPVRRRSRPMRSPSRSTTQIVAPRGLSTRPTPIAASPPRRRCALPGRTGPSSSRRAISKRLLAARARAARAGRARRRRGRVGHGGLEVRRRRAGPTVARASSATPPRARPGRRRRGARRPPRADDADVRAGGPGTRR